MVDRCGFCGGDGDTCFKVVGNYNKTHTEIGKGSSFLLLFVHERGERVIYERSKEFDLTQRVWFLSRFGLKTGIDFDHYGLKSGMVFKGTTRAYKRICLFNSK